MHPVCTLLILPKHQNVVPKMNFPEFPGTRVSVEILQKT